MYKWRARKWVKWKIITAICNFLFSCVFVSCCNCSCPIRDFWSTATTTNHELGAWRIVFQSFLVLHVVVLLLLHTKVLTEKLAVEHVLTVVNTGKLNMTTKRKQWLQSDCKRNQEITKMQAWMRVCQIGLYVWGLGTYKYMCQFYRNMWTQQTKNWGNKFEVS